MQCGLNDGVRLGVNRADAVSIHHEMTDFVAMSCPAGEPLKPVVRMRFSRTSTHPTKARSQVLRSDTA